MTITIKNGSLSRNWAMNQQPTQLLLDWRTESIKFSMLSIPNYFVKNKFHLFDINLIYKGDWL